MLVAAGFRMFTVGDPEAPDMLVYVRPKAGGRDMVRVYAPAECEAVRMVHGKPVRQVEGTTMEVVRAVLDWSGLIITPFT
jgi:hypothetical protein